MSDSLHCAGAAERAREYNCSTSGAGVCSPPVVRCRPLTVFFVQIEVAFGPRGGPREAAGSSARAFAVFSDSSVHSAVPNRLRSVVCGRAYDDADLAGAGDPVLASAIELSRRDSAIQTIGVLVQLVECARQHVQGQ